MTGSMMTGSDSSLVLPAILFAVVALIILGSVAVFCQRRQRRSMNPSLSMSLLINS